MAPIGTKRELKCKRKSSLSVQECCPDAAAAGKRQDARG